MRHSGQFKPAGQEPRRGKGGKREGAGRPTKEKQAIKEEVKRLVERELERNVRAVIGAGLEIATGVKRRKHDPKTGERYFELEYDSSMIRFWIERFAPPAKTSIQIDDNRTPDALFRQLAEDLRREEEERKTVEPDAKGEGAPKEVELLSYDEDRKKK